jgi:hypothetical protein
MTRKKDDEVPALEAPSAGELDVLSVLWHEQLGDNQLLQLSEIHRRVCERRRQFGEPEPALTTTSGQLRSLSDKKLIGPGATQGSGTPRPPLRTRGGYTPPSRASAASYRALHGPGEVLFTTFRGLAAAYPEEKRLDALLDFARALGVSDACLRGLQEVVGRERASGTTEAI